MAYNPTPPLGQSTKANSTPVTVASDQEPLNTKLTTGLAATTGTITTNTSTVVLTSLLGVGSVTVTFAGTYAGVNASFEAYDGTNWFPVAGLSTVSVASVPVLATGVLTANSTVAFNISPLLGFTQFRVRATAYTSGTANVSITPSAQFVQYLTSALQGGTWTVQPGNTANTTPWLTTAVTRTTGGALRSRVASAASTNATSAKATAGTLLGWALYNTSAAAKYFKLYNLAAAPTVGTSTPVTTILLPAGGGSNIWLGPTGDAYATGISYAITSGAADADTTAVAANDVIGVIWYT